MSFRIERDEDVPYRTRFLLFVEGREKAVASGEVRWRRLGQGPLEAAVCWSAIGDVPLEWAADFGAGLVELSRCLQEEFQRQGGA